MILSNGMATNMVKEEKQAVGSGAENQIDIRGIDLQYPYKEVIIAVMSTKLDLWNRQSRAGTCSTCSWTFASST